MTSKRYRKRAGEYARRTYQPARRGWLQRVIPQRSGPLWLFGLSILLIIGFTIQHLVHEMLLDVVAYASEADSTVTAADLPEGYATMANFRSKGVPRAKRFLLSASFFLYVTTAAILSYFLLRDAPESVKLICLVVTAGLLTVAALEDMLAEAHEASEDNRRSVVALLCGFALFTFLSSGLEAFLTR